MCYLKELCPLLVYTTVLRYLLFQSRPMTLDEFSWLTFQHENHESMARMEFIRGKGDLIREHTHLDHDGLIVPFRPHGGHWLTAS